MRVCVCRGRLRVQRQEGGVFVQQGLASTSVSAGRGGNRAGGWAGRGCGGGAEGARLRADPVPGGAAAVAEAPAKPPRGPAQRGRGGRAGRGAGGLGGGREEGGAAQPAPRRRPLGPRRPRPQHESRVRHAPSPGEGWGRAGRRAGRDGVPGEEAPGATRAGAPGRVTAAGGRREGERGRAGGAGRGLSLGLAQETGRRAGPTGCQFGPLVYSWRGSFNPKGGRAGGKTWSRIRGPRSGGGADGGTAEGARAAAFLEGPG